MLTIQNINIINSKFAGTNEWSIGEIFISEGSYVFEIIKRTGEWAVAGAKLKSLTIRLVREGVMNSYIMETGVIKQNYYGRSMHSIDNMKTISLFTMCLDAHIRTVIR